jgi:hypothetical protein
MSGGSGGGSSQTTAYQTNIPEYAAPYFQGLLGQANALSNQPYQPYTGERTAQFTPLQTQAFQGAQQRQIAPQLAPASMIAQNAAMQASGPSVVAGNIGFERVQPGQVGTQAFTTPGAAQAYMSPYMQNVVDIQQRDAQRQADISRTQRGAQAVGQGAFGGSRQAIMDAEAARNLAMQKGDIQAQGLQSAYTQGRDAFMADQARTLQAQQTNLQALMDAQKSNQQAGLVTGQAGLDSYMKAQLANQQANLTGAQTAIQGAQTLGQLGQQQFGQESDILGQKMNLGTAQQQQIQNILGQQQTDFQAQRNYPYQQLGFFSDLLRGVQGTSRQMYTPSPSTFQNLAALGGTAMGISKMMAKGGTVKAAGLQELAMSRMKGKK